jgi:hypothetical protein
VRGLRPLPRQGRRKPLAASHQRRPDHELERLSERRGGGVPARPASTSSNASTPRASKGLTTSLNSKLDEALAALDANDTAGACDSLRGFLNQVAAQADKKKLTEAQVQQLTDAANEIRALLDC